MSMNLDDDERSRRGKIPFDTALLDRLMDAEGIDVLLATSKHAVQYLLGGHRFFFFDYMDAIGTNRYLPIVVYFKGHPEKAGYIGNEMENYVNDITPFWPDDLGLKVWGVDDAISLAVSFIARSGLPANGSGSSRPFFRFRPHRARAAASGGGARRRAFRPRAVAGEKDQERAR